MMNSVNDFVIIGQDVNTKDYFIHERENNNDGKIGKINLMADGKGDVRNVINSYVDKGYKPENIIYNGQPVTDVFTKVEDNNGKVSFKGVYKVTMPKVDKIKDKQEKEAMTDLIINTVVMATNNSIAKPKATQDNKSILFKIDDKKDAMFEQSFQNILDDCNKRFNMDLAKKVYVEKVSEEDYNNGVELK